MCFILAFLFRLCVDDLWMVRVLVQSLGYSYCVLFSILAIISLIVILFYAC